MHGAGRAASGHAGRVCSGLCLPAAFGAGGAAVPAQAASPGPGLAQGFAAVPLTFALLTPLLSSARQLD